MTMLEVTDYLRIARRWWAVPVAGVAIGVGAAMYQVDATPQTYTATSTMYVTMATGTSVADSYQGGLAAQQRVRSYLELVTSDRVVDRVIGQLGLPADREELRGKIAADTPPATSLLRVSVTDENAETSRLLTDQVVSQFRALVDELETIEVTAAPAARVAVVDSARTPATPDGPGGSRLLMVGGLAGLLLGAAAAYLLDRADRRIRGSAEVARLGPPVLGTVALGKDSATADLRQVRARLPEAKLLVLTGFGAASEARAILELATCLGAAGDRVLLIDADTRGHGVSALLPDPLPVPVATAPAPTDKRRDLVPAGAGRGATLSNLLDPPTITLDLRKVPKGALDELDAEAAPPRTGHRAADGLGVVLRGQARFADALIPWPDRSITVLALGKSDEHTPDHLASAIFDTVLAEAAADFDRVVVGSSPADVLTISPKADAVVGLVAVGTDRQDRVDAILTALAGAGAPVSGLITLADRRPWWRRW